MSDRQNRIPMSIWAYPWDVARLGVDEVLNDIRDHGIGAINMAATYHPVDALSPRGRGGLRLFSSSRGAVVFPADKKKYGRIKPALLADQSVVGVWREVAAKAEKFSIKLNPWIIALFQPWIADNYPGCVRVLPTGDPLTAGVCPASADVRHYISTLCADLADQFGATNFRLEGIMFTPFDHGWVRARVLIPLSPEAKWLLGLCFCPSCAGRNRATGIDVDALRARVIAKIDGELSGTGGRIGSLEVSVQAWIEEDEELAAFLVERKRSTLDLAQAVVDALGIPESGRTVYLTSATHPDSITSADEVVPDLLEAFDGILCHPLSLPDEARHLKQMSARSAGRVKLVAMLTSPAAAPPMMTASLSDQIEAAYKLPVDEVSIYNYGLLRATDLDDMTAAVDELSARA